MNLVLAKTKLKHMCRQIWDYPELRNTIGSMMLYDVKEKAKMAVQSTNGGYTKTPVKYNAYFDRDDPNAAQEREADWQDKKAFKRVNGDLDHAGNHELGHVLGSTMVTPGADLATAIKETTVRKTENDILKEVLLNQNILSRKQKRGIKVYDRDGRDYFDNKGMAIPPEKLEPILRKRKADLKSGKAKKSDRIEGVTSIHKHYKGQLDTGNSPTLENRNITSMYGSSSATEMFAETFGDVYTHGAAAKPVSIATVKEYEKRQKEMQRMKYTYNQSNWFMKLFRTKVI